MLSKEVSSTIFWVFGMTWPGSEPRSPGPLANTLTIVPVIFAIDGSSLLKVFNEQNYFVHPKILRPKPCLLMFTSLVALDSFHLLLSTHLIADLTLEWSGGSMFPPLSHINTKTPFHCFETVANNTLNRRCVVVFDQVWASTVHTLYTTFSLTNIHAKWWILCLPISSSPLLSHVTSIDDWPKWVWGVFWCFPRQLLNLGDLSIQHHLCLYDRVSIPPLNRCFRWSLVRITLIN